MTPEPKAVQNLTKGQMEAEISKLLIRFEKEHIGRGPEGARTYLVADMAVVRLRGVLTPAERYLAKDPNGSALIREMRLRLVESSQSLLETWIQDLTGCKVLNLLTDISTKTGEHILVFVFDQNLEELFRDRRTAETPGRP